VTAFATDPVGAVRGASEALWSCEAPYIIGVRHHSPALAAAVPELLDAFAPERVLVELPMELEPWIEWLANPDTVAPIALAAVRENGGDLSFYPFADFSPELAAIRWAFRAGIPVAACDLPWASPAWRSHTGTPDVVTLEPGGGLTAHLHRTVGVNDGEELWDRLVEVRAPGSSAEAIRRAALSVGWALRQAAPQVDGTDLSREAWMRKEVSRLGVRTAAVVGAFHAPALLPTTEAQDDRGSERNAKKGGVVTSLIPYTFPLLDSRSGYPAGIRDPEWQQAAFESGRNAAAIGDRAGAFAVQIASTMRDAGHAAGTVDAQEVLRVTADLARLRNLAAPGRRELVEACTAVLAQGEPLGRGRAVARAMGTVLVGGRHGRLAPGTPRSGLGPHVEALLAELRLPGPGDPPADLRLDALRSDLDRRRHVTLQRLTVCGVPYGQLIGGVALGAETLTQRWSISWEPATSAMVDLAGLHGVTLEQAAVGALRSRWARAVAEEGGVTPLIHLAGLRLATEAGLEGLAEERIRGLRGAFLNDAGLAELIVALEQLERIGRGHVPGFTPSDDLARWLSDEIQPQLLATAVKRLEGLSGSDRAEDAAALASLVRRIDADDSAIGGGRIGWALAQIGRDGAPLMQGAAEAIRALTRRVTPAGYAALLGSWLDGAVDATSHLALSGRLRGTCLVAAPFLESAAAILDGLCDRVEALTDGAFVSRLPAMRDGFDILSTAARFRFLQAIIALRGLDAVADLALEASADTIALWAQADEDGTQAVLGEGFEFDPNGPDPDAEPSEQAQKANEPRRNGIGLLDRWRLILGQEPDALEEEARPIAASLDELYGAHGEGARSGLGAGDGRGGQFPTAREWSDQLEAVFGARVREEVLGRAAERGRLSVVDQLDPKTVTPSVELLQQVLSLAGAVPEANMGPLRQLVRRIVEALVAELAVRVRPAITGAILPRTTRRRGGKLHLRRTVTANLRTARVAKDGTVTVVPESTYFHVRGRRSFDWRVVLCVDVSGSMEESVVYSALMAAILSGLPALTTNFVAFSDRVVDLSDRVEDPLGLLLEIRVGGGTHIAAALSYARTLVTVPARTIVVVVSDFEEGGPVSELIAEVRALAGGGSRLLGLAALDDRGAPRYDTGIAEQLVAAGMPIAALTPMELARWLGEQLRGD
jgi:hypothetical protein